MKKSQIISSFQSRIPVSRLVKLNFLFLFSGFNVTLSTEDDELFFLNNKKTFQKKIEVQENEKNCETVEVLTKVSVHWVYF